jgi:hypothetical protein
VPSRMTWSRIPSGEASFKDWAEYARRGQAIPGGGEGKRGGFRYWYLYLERRDHIHLLLLLDKDEQEDLDFQERAALRRMVVELKRI